MASSELAWDEIPLEDLVISLPLLSEPAICEQKKPEPLRVKPVKLEPEKSADEPEFPAGKKGVKKIKAIVDKMHYPKQEAVDKVLYDFLVGYMKTHDGDLTLPFVKEDLPRGMLQNAWATISGTQDKNKSKLHEFVLTPVLGVKHNRSLVLTTYGDEVGAAHGQQKGNWSIGTARGTGGNSMLGLKSDLRL